VKYGIGFQIVKRTELKKLVEFTLLICVVGHLKHLQCEFLSLSSPPFLVILLLRRSQFSR